jgi:hypothetical protein
MKPRNTRNTRNRRRWSATQEGRRGVAANWRSPQISAAFLPFLSPSRHRQALARVSAHYPPAQSQSRLTSAATDARRFMVPMRAKSSGVRALHEPATRSGRHPCRPAGSRTIRQPRWPPLRRNQAYCKARSQNRQPSDFGSGWINPRNMRPYCNL